MKKVISLLTALILCLTMACTVFAAKDPFVPSINYRDDALIVPVFDGDGNKALGVIRDADGNVLAYVDGVCLLVTSIAEALDFRYAMPEDLRTALVDVYNALTDGSMKLPYEKLDTELKSSEIAIRELIDATLICEEHSAMLAEDGVVIDLTFDLGIGADDSVFVMNYINEEWDTDVELVNNGDGTVTCTFEDLCPIAVCVAEDQPETPSWVARAWNALTNWLSRFFN